MWLVCLGLVLMAWFRWKRTTPEPETPEPKPEARPIAAKLDSAALESYTERKIRIVPNKIAPTQLGVWRGSMSGRVS